VPLRIGPGYVPAATVYFEGDVIKGMPSRRMLGPTIDEVKAGDFVWKVEDDAATLGKNEGAEPEDLRSLPIRLKEDKTQRGLGSPVLGNRAKRALEDSRLIGVVVYFPESKCPIDIQEWHMSPLLSCPCPVAPRWLDIMTSDG
jgi:hypothetical protein